eukprot:715371-Amphidinium_carterae.1
MNHSLGPSWQSSLVCRCATVAACEKYHECNPLDSCAWCNDQIDGHVPSAWCTRFCLLRRRERDPCRSQEVAAEERTCSQQRAQSVVRLSCRDSVVSCIHADKEDGAAGKPKEDDEAATRT